MKLTQYFETRTDLLHVERRLEAVTEEIKQAKYDLRAAEETHRNYRGSFQTFLDKLSGNREKAEETLRRQLRAAKKQLEALLREQEALTARQKELKEKEKALPSPEELRRTEGKALWAEGEAKYCAEVLAPLLEENRKALLESRSLMRGEHPEILSERKRQEIYAGPNIRAERCLPWLHRLAEAMEVLEMPFDMGDYYRSPAAYLVNSVAMHNRRDRVNNALDQVEEKQKLVKKFL